jgi:hypothetical protein
MPCWNSDGKVASDSAGTPIASSPAKLKSHPSETGRSGSNEETGSSRGSAAQQFPPCVPVVDAQREIRAAYGLGRGIRAAAWMSSSSSEVSVSVVMMLPQGCWTAAFSPVRGGGARRPRKPGAAQSAALLEQRLERRVLERLLGGGVVEHLLEGLLQALGLDDLRHRPVLRLLKYPVAGLCTDATIFLSPPTVCFTCASTSGLSALNFSTPPDDSTHSETAGYWVVCCIQSRKCSMPIRTKSSK